MPRTTKSGTDEFESSWIASITEDEALKDVAVLVVDDHSFMRNLVERMLGDLGASPIHLASGAEQALAMIAKGLAPLDIVLCDLRMPDTDGIAFVTGLRATGNKIPVLILTGNATATNIGAAIQAGAQGFVAKPITAAVLASHIASVLAVKDAPTEATGE